MNPHNIATTSLIVYSIFHVIMSIVLYIKWDDSFDPGYIKDKKKKRADKWLISGLITIPTVWIISPWVGLGLYNIHRYNTGKVNDLARQERVLEPAEKVRKSKSEELKENE